MYEATLVKGKTYHVAGITFRQGRTVKVNDELGEYLKTLDQFEVSRKSSGKKSSKNGN